jgi:5'-nucleotidase/UDP-sugar diphosphatase
MDQGRHHLLALLTALLLVALPPPFGGVEAGLNFTLLHSQDGYGSVVPLDAANQPCTPTNGAPYYLPFGNGSGPCLGGLARRSGVVDAVREEVGADRVVLVDAGNALMGSVFYMTFGSEVIATYYALMGYDAVKLEVHDFTSHVSQVANFVRLLENSTVVVSSNLINLNNDTRFLAGAGGAEVMPFALVHLDGGRDVVGFVGTMSQGLNAMFANPGRIDSTNEVVALRNTVAYLQNRGINKIIASVSGVSVVDAVVTQVPGIDVLIVLSELYGTNLSSSAASPGPYPTVRWMPWQQPLLIVGTGVNNGRYLGRLDLAFDDYGVVEWWDGAPILLDDDSPVDAVMQADIEQRQAVVDKQSSKVVGRSDVALAYEHRCMFGECTIGAWSVDAMRAVGQTQIAFANGGTMYGGIGEGDITWGQLCDALPLQNGELQTYRIMGRHLCDALENSVKLVTDTQLNLNQGVGRFLQVSGLRVLYNPHEQVGMRIVDVTVETEPGWWERLDPQRYYTVSSFRWVSVLGGDDYTMIRDNLRDLRPTGITGTTAWLTALAAAGTVSSVTMGRLNTTSLSRRSCIAPDSGLVCSGNGRCVRGACMCDDGGQDPLCVPQSESGSGSLVGGEIAGIVVGSALAAVCVLGCVVVVTALLASARKRPEQREWLIDFEELEIGDLLGRGGYGEVYRGNWKGTGVAVKTINSAHITRAMRQSFVEETSIMSRLRHPNVVLFMAASTKPPLLCIVMEYMALGSLYDVRSALLFLLIEECMSTQIPVHSCCTTSS